MHKKLAADLTSIAHSILQLKNKEDVILLKEKAYQVYEKLAVLAYVDEYIRSTPNTEETKESLLEKIEDAEKVAFTKSESKEIPEEIAELEEDLIEETELEPVSDKEIMEEESVENSEELLEAQDESVQKEEIVAAKVEQKNIKMEITNEVTVEKEEEISIEEMQLDDERHGEVEAPIADTIIEEKSANKQMTLEEELSDTISLDVAADLFEKAPERQTINDRVQHHLQIGLNDRIAFVKNLFDGNQEDFNRILSQINTLKTLKEVKKFLNKQVKPDYNWKDKEEYELRFMELIERKFE